MPRPSHSSRFYHPHYSERMIHRVKPQSETIYAMAVDFIFLNTASVNKNYRASNKQCRRIMNGTGCEKKRTCLCYGGLALLNLEETSGDESGTLCFFQGSQPVPPKYTSTFCVYIQKIKI
jgi:hypothetical protein